MPPLSTTCGVIHKSLWITFLRVSPCALHGGWCRRTTVGLAPPPSTSPQGRRTVKRSSFGSLPFALDRNLRSESCRGRGCEGSGNRDGKEPRRPTLVLSTERVKGTLKGEPNPSTLLLLHQGGQGSRRYGPRWVDFSSCPLRPTNLPSPPPCLNEVYPLPLPLPREGERREERVGDRKKRREGSPKG